jgi:hypothetical protein
MQTKMPASTEQSKQNQTVHSPTQLFVEPHAVFKDHRQQSAQLKETQTNMAVSQQQQGLQALQAKMNTGSRIQQLKEQQAQSNQSPKPNNTGLPDNLKSGIENLSGMSMDHVKVHYNSDKPAQLQAYAYAQGSEIHVAPGQEQHVPHEAWHVVQQAQGRVKPTVQMKGDVPLNDAAGLEAEADVMGVKALQTMTNIQPTKPTSQVGRISGSVQRKIKFSDSDVLENIIALNQYLARDEENEEHAPRLTDTEQSVAKWLLRDSTTHDFGTLAAFQFLVENRNKAADKLANRFGIVHSSGREFAGKDETTRFMVQTPQMRGDMHDVRAAMAVDSELQLIFCMTGGDRIPDAGEILSFYSGLEARITIVAGEPSGIKVTKGTKIGMADATLTLVDASKKDAVGTRDKIKTAITGNPNSEEENAYRITLQEQGFQSGVPYCIVNYRDSGHKPEPGRAPSHPELDTGTAGLVQLCNLVTKRGFTPVVMGSPPNSGIPKPNLVNYFAWDCCKPGRDSTRNKRQAEYGLLRYMAEHLNIRGLSMRSGVTDAMVFAGIETISLDVAYIEDASWQRAALRDQIMPGTFHQGFFEPRDDDQEGSFVPKWEGEFDNENLIVIDKLIDHFFGTAAKQIQRSTKLDPRHPFLNPEQSHHIIGDHAKALGQEVDIQKSKEPKSVSSKKQAPQSSELKELNQRFKYTNASLEFFGTNFETWKSAKEDIDPQIPLLNIIEDVNHLMHAMDDFSDGLRRLQNQLDMLGKEINALAVALEQLERRLHTL